MIGLTLVHSRRRRVHAVATLQSGPRCGGGRGGRSQQWQQTIEPCTCAACLKILHPPAVVQTPGAAEGKGA